MANEETPTRSLAGKVISIVIVLCALLTAALVIWRTNRLPRTDDAEVFANFIGIAPLVEGPIVKLYVQDNQYVKKGDLLYEVDPRPYQYALEKAYSDQKALEGQITDERRTIAGESSGVEASQASILNAEAKVESSKAAIQEAKADVTNATAGVARAQAELTYANDNYRRIEPLLAKQFVTVDQVDLARTAVETRQQALDQMKSQLALAKAHLLSVQAQYDQAKAALAESHAVYQQSKHNVLTLDPLVGQLGAKASAIETAQYNLDNCRVYAPFDALVTNLTISQGAYAHIGEKIFTLIDTDEWWAIANYRETQLKEIQPGMAADVYVMSRPGQRIRGYVDSVGYGVQPDADLLGRLTPGLPDVQRTLNWVHLASRYPVRVRITPPKGEMFRIGESAVVVIRGDAPRNRRW